MPGQVRIERSGPLAKLVLDHPQGRNAITTAMWDAIATETARLGEEAASVLVVSSAVPGTFSVGAHLNDVERARSGPAPFEARMTAAHVAVLRFPGVVIAAVDGPCLGAGLALALAADVRLCTERSTFAIPAGRLGLGYPPLETRLLVATVGLAVARRLLLRAARLGAGEAIQASLVDDVLPSTAALDSAVSELVVRAEEVAPLATKANRLTLLCASLPEVVGNRADQARRECWASEDLTEGLRAVRERRAPRFTGR